MESSSSTYRSFPGDHSNNMEIVSKGNGNNQMFVGKSLPRPLDFSTWHTTRESKPKKGSKKGSSTSWWNDPETKRRRRVAKYKLYSAEGKFKTSFRHGIRWVKRKCSQIAHQF